VLAVELAGPNEPGGLILASRGAGKAGASGLNCT